MKQNRIFYQLLCILLLVGLFCQSLVMRSSVVNAQSEQLQPEPIPVDAAQVATAPIQIKVNTTIDEWNYPGNTNEAIQSKCSLREALQAVVGNVVGNQGCGYVAPNEVEYVLKLLPGTYKLTTTNIPANNLKSEPMPMIGNGKKVMIDGANNVTIDGGRQSGRHDGIFKVTGGWLVLTNVTLQNGSALFGCAINQNGGFVEIDTSIFKENSCIDNAGVVNTGGEGGAIYSTGTLSITNTLFEKNGARLYGGALRAGGNTYLKDVTFKKNYAWMGGGAIGTTGNLQVVESLFDENVVVGHPNQIEPYNHLDDHGSGGAIQNSGFLVLDKVAFQKNSTYKVKGGGALGNEGGEVHIYDSAFKGNYAKPQEQVQFTYGGAIYNVGKLDVVRSTIYQNEASYGGAIFNRSGNLSLANSTISTNKATKEAPGISNGHPTFPNSENGDTWIDHATIVYNIDASGKYHSLYSYQPERILALNSLFDGGCDHEAITTRGFNIFGQPCATISDVGLYDFRLADINPISNTSKVNLGGLTHNGGPALKGGVNFSSHKPNKPSAAIDAAGDEGCKEALVAKTDQANQPRNQGKCDMGAIEGGIDPAKFASLPAENATIEFPLPPEGEGAVTEATLQLKNDGGGVYFFEVEISEDVRNAIGHAVALEHEDNTTAPPIFELVEGSQYGWVFPDKPATVKIRCHPRSYALDYYTYIGIRTNLPGDKVPNFTLHCVRPDPVNAHASPSQPSGPASMGSPQPGSTAQTSFEIVGRGKVPVNMSAQSTTNSNGVISISAVKGGVAAASTGSATEGSINVAEPITLANGEKATVTATCAPTSEGIFQETLTIETDDPKAPTLTYNFSCEGVYKVEPEKLFPTTFVNDLSQHFLSVAVSPDGTQLIGGYSFGFGLLVAARNPVNGTLSNNLQVSTSGMGGAIGDIEYSHDGKQVYLASENGDSVIVMNRAADNSLSFSQVISKESVHLCGVVNGLPKFCPIGVMHGPQSLAVSPDDRQVYVASTFDGSLTVLQRNPSNPTQLYYRQSFTRTINGVSVMTNASDVLVSPDGRNVYVTAHASDTINVFTRAEDGSLSYLRSYRDEQDGINTLKFPDNMAISQDGKFIYVPSLHDDALNVFARSESDGSLKLVQTVPDLDGALSVEISHDPAGERLLLALRDGDALQVYSRNVKTGKVTFVESHGIAANPKFDMPMRLASSPDDRNVYVALKDGSGIQAFASLHKVPVLALISPVSAQADSGDLTLTVNGNNFYPHSQVLWGGKPLLTTFVDSHKLKAVVTAANLTKADMVNIQVRNAPLGTSDSLAKLFAVTRARPSTPSISSIDPAALDGSVTEKTSLLVKGAYFTPQSKVLLNGAPLPTTYINTSTLVAIFTPGAVSVRGPLALSVSNNTLSVEVSSAGADVTAAETHSAAFKFETTDLGTPATPAIQSLSPASIAAGSDEIEVTVHGFNFSELSDARSVLLWNGEPRATTVINSKLLLATITKADLATAGKASVKIYTPSIDESSPAHFTILAAGENPVPQIHSSFADSFADSFDNADGTQWQLSVNGAGLVAGAQLILNGQSRATTWVNDTQVTALLSEAEINSGALIQVVNPQPGGGASNEIVVLPRQAQSIDFAALTNKVLGGSPFVINAGASSELPVSFSSATPTICTVSQNETGWMVTLVAVGTCTIVAAQAGDGEFTPAQVVERSFQVLAAGSQPGGTTSSLYLPLVQR